MPAAPAISAEPPTASAWEWTQVGLLVANLTWTTLCLGGFRPETIVVTGTLSCLLLGVHLLSYVFGPEGRESPGRTQRFHPAGWLFLPFLAYAAVNVCRLSPVPWIGWRDWFGWAQAVAVFWVVLNGIRDPRARATLFYALVVLGLVAVTLAAYQRFMRPEWLMLGRTQSPYFVGRGSGPFGIPNSLAAFLILIIPGTAAIGFRRGATALQAVWCIYVALLLVGGLVLTISRGAWLSLGLVALVWPILAVRRSWVRRIAFTAVVLAVMVALGAALASHSPRVQRRLLALRADHGEISRGILWRGGWALFREAPWCGHGAGSFNFAFEQHRPEGFLDNPGWVHNEYLNLLDDYGLVGAALLAGAVGVLIVVAWRTRIDRRGERSTRPTAPPTFAVRSRLWWPVPRQALAAGLAAFALQSTLEFNLKIPALALAAAVVAAFWVQTAWPAPAGSMVGSWWRSGAICAAAALVGIGALGYVYPAWRAEGLRYRARQAIDGLAVRSVPEIRWMDTLAPARRRLEAAVRLDPNNGTAWADLSYVLALSASLEPKPAELAREAERAADEALRRSTTVPEFWIRRGVALDLRGQWAEAGTAFAQALILAPARPDLWLRHALHLSLRRGHRRDALAAAEFCLRLDPGNREAQALRARLADRIRAH